MIIKSSFVLDTMNLFSILTGNPFYTEHHQEVANFWHQRLSSTSQTALQQA